MLRNFIQMSTILKESSVDDFAIEFFSFTSEKIKNLRWLNQQDPMAFTHFLKPDYTYTRLINTKTKTIWMSDTPMEIKTNQNFLNQATGSVLIFGLGMGLIVAPLLEDENITKITIIENNSSIIKLVSPFFQHSKINIIEAAAITFEPPKNIKYDTIYFDIWPSISADNYEEMLTLHKKYRKFKNKENTNNYMSSWLFDYCKKLIYKERKEEKMLEHIFKFGY